MNLLLIDDDINLCKVLAHQLEKNGYKVRTANMGKEGLQLFKDNPCEIIITDIQMPDIKGIEVLQNIRRLDQQVVIIVITAYGTVENAIEACRLGANDYLTKPFSQEQLIFVLEKALKLRELQVENTNLLNQLRDKFQFKNLISRSAVMEEVQKTAARVASSEATVLLTGESGTGKELLARGIHYQSARRDKALITVNCPTIPDNLIESELFGHVRGAFTGAIRDRVGKFEQANGGTIFLDEIGDLKHEVQAKLLRVLQEREFERLGDEKTIKVDVRVIAATNKNLEDLVEKGNFREDLYYRLSVVPLRVPPLRERIEDIPFLVDSFLSRYSKDRKITIGKGVIDSLQKYHWPGNVRELENIMERMIALTEGSSLTTNDIPPHILSDREGKMSSQIQVDHENVSLHEIEKHVIEQALFRTNNNQSEAARLLKIPRHVLLYRMKKFGIP